MLRCLALIVALCTVRLDEMGLIDAVDAANTVALCRSNSSS